MIVIDMQNDFVDGSLANPAAQKIVPLIARKIAERRSRGDKVWFTRDTHGADYLKTAEGKKLPVEHCAKGSRGWQIVDALRPAPNDTVIDKPTFGFKDWSLFARELSVAEEIELVGTCTDICVVSNALALKAVLPETPIACDASCCAGVTQARHEAALDVMDSCQIDVRGR